MEGSEEDRKMRESFKLRRDWLNGCDQNADSDTDSEVKATKVSNEREAFIRSWSKDHTCYSLSKSLAVFRPCPRHLWKFKLKSHSLRNLAEEICN